MQPQTKEKEKLFWLNQFLVYSWCAI